MDKVKPGNKIANPKIKKRKRVINREDKETSKGYYKRSLEYNKRVLKTKKIDDDQVPKETESLIKQLYKTHEGEEFEPKKIIIGTKNIKKRTKGISYINYLKKIMDGLKTNGTKKNRT